MSRLLPRPIGTLPNAFLIVCEGWGDANFFDRLLAHHKIANCSVGCPSRDACQGQPGDNDLQRYLSNVAFLYHKQEPATFRGIVVVVDADTDPDGQFIHAKTALEFARFPSPDQPFVLVEDAQTNLRSSVFLMPGPGRTGTIENILLEATLGSRPELEDCINRFAECTKIIPTGTENEQAKMKMSVIVGGSCKGNPWAPVSLVWSDKGNPIPIASPVFHPLADFVRGFCTQ